MDLDGGRRPLLFLLLLVVVAGIAFIAAILAGLSTGFDLHEIGGAVLFVLLLLALWVAVRLRPRERPLVVRIAIALGALILAGVLGALLATSDLPGLAAGLPLVPLGVTLLSSADGIRLIVRSPARRA